MFLIIPQREAVWSSKPQEGEMPEAPNPPGSAAEDNAAGLQEAGSQADAQADAAKQDAEQQPADGDGKGSKQAVLADLAGERDKRQGAEKAQADTQAKLDAVLAALGIGEPEDPAKAAEQYKTQAQTAEQKLAVFTAAPAGVDAHALLDSQAFIGSLADVPADKLADHITAYAEANPRFKLAPANAGARDAAQRGTQPAPQKSMDDWLRGR